MVFAARKKQLIAIQFRYFGRAYNTRAEKSPCECDAEMMHALSARTPYEAGSQLPAKHKAALHDVRQDRDLPAPGSGLASAEVRQWGGKRWFVGTGVETGRRKAEGPDYHLA